MLTWEDRDGKRHEFEKVPQREILGCVISEDNRATLQHRLAEASSAFWRHSGYFCSMMISWREKMREYARRTRPVALYGSVIVTWSAEVSNQLRVWENTMLRRMCRVAWRKEEETFAEWRRRHTKICRGVAQSWPRGYCGVDAQAAVCLDLFVGALVC